MQTDLAQLKKADAKIVCATGFALPEEKLDEVIARDLAFYEAHCAADPAWRMVRTRGDLQEIMVTPDAHGIIFHIEGFPGFTGDWQLLEKWHAEGLRSVGLVWNDDDPLGGGTNSESGLTELGREFIAWCEERNILIDLAHANPMMFKDCLATITKPPFISHGGLYSVVPNRRNFTSGQLREVTSRGGIFGIFLAKSSMAKGRSFSVADIAQHIKTAVDLLGEDAVAMGTDFGGMTSGTPEGLSSVSEMENLWEELGKQGFTSRRTEKIAIGNARRYLSENLPQA